jgi:hypothetical protein
MFIGFTNVAALKFLLRLNYIYRSYFLYPAIGGKTFGLNNASMKLMQYLLKPLLSVLLGTYVRMDQMLILHLAALGATKLFSTVVAPFHIPTSNPQKLQFFPIFDNTFCSLVVVSFLK